MKTIVMYEGNQSHTFSASKLRTPLQDGGTCDWVPEDETEVGTTFISENGTYRASSEDLYGFSEVTVNVPGGEGSAGSDGYPSYTPPSGSTPASGTPSGGVGSSIIGTNPDTGNEEYVGVDENGQLVTTPIPTSIVLVTNPTKMSYQDGESINLAGAVVVAKMADGTTWTDADHPNGHIPLGELVVEPTAADKSKVQDSGMSSDFDLGEVNQPVPYSAGWLEVVVDNQYYWWSHYLRNTYEGRSDVRFICLAKHEVAKPGVEYYANSALWASEQPLNTDPVVMTYYRDNQNPIVRDLYGNNSYTYDNKTVYWYEATNGDPVESFSAGQFLQQGISSLIKERLMWTLIYGTPSGGTQSIALKWHRPADGKELETTLDVEVGNSGS